MDIGRIKVTNGTRGFKPALLALPALLVGAAAGNLQAALKSTADSYLQNIAAIAPVAGRDTAYDYYSRLAADAAELADPAVPPGYTPEDWHATARATATLDLSLARQLVTKRFVPIGTIRGLGESFVRSSKDGTMQPVAAYVPSTYAPGKPAPLVVFLHGHAQSETALLAPPYVAKLAERTGSIVIAPYGRGYYDFRGSVSDVYDAVDAADAAFAIDPRKRFLAGYSMGGFSVFEVAPERPTLWAAVMCIAGALLGSDSQRVVTFMRRTPFYVLTGSADQSIPTQYPTVTAAYLRSAGFDVSYYSLAGGIHRLVTLLPILTQAWDDMHHGVVRAPPPQLGSLALPSAPPVNALKP